MLRICLVLSALFFLSVIPIIKDPTIDYGGWETRDRPSDLAGRPTSSAGDCGFNLTQKEFECYYAGGWHVAGMPAKAVFNVKKFGAKGDDITDDVKPINGAFAAARSSIKSAQITEVYFAPGTYKITSSVNGASLTPNAGSKHAMVNGNRAIIDCFLSTGPCVDMLNNFNLTIKDLTLFSLPQSSPSSAVQTNYLEPHKVLFDGLWVYGHFTTASIMLYSGQGI